MPNRDNGRTAESADASADDREATGSATPVDRPTPEADHTRRVQVLRERVRELAAVPPESRDDLLAAADAALPVADAQVLHAVFDPPAESLVLSDALRVAREAGYTRADAVALFAASLHADDLQERWVDSQDVERRDEVLLRLQVLASAPRVDEALVSFLMLYLRSPDPAVYQAAAMAIGRHLDAQPDLLAYVRKYAATRDLDLGTPTALDGNRTRRRVLLVQAAARASVHPDDGEGDTVLPDLLTSGLPLDPDAVDAESVTNAEDATILLLSSRLLLDVPDLVADVAPMARDLVRAFPTDDVVDVPPILLQRWGELLDALLTRDLMDASSAADAWRDVLERVAAALRDAARDVPALTHALFLLDEHARTLARLPDAVGADAAAAQESLPAALRALLQTRVRVWRRARNADPPTGWPNDLSTTPSNASPALRALLRARPTFANASVGAVGPVEFDLETIDGLLAPLGDRARWEALGSSERALRAAFLLVTMQNFDGAYERVASTLRTHAIPIPPGNDARSRALAAVVLRLIQFEGMACARAIDSRILESVSDLGVLLTLLPTDESPAVAADLADNLEHQIRWNLQHDPDFRPIQLLVRTTVRDPHPAFYRALRAIVARRTYTDSTGRRVPLDAALDALLRDEDATDADPWRRDDLETADRLVSARSRARERLAGVAADEGSLWDTLDRLLAALGVPTGPRDEPADDTLLGLVGLVHPADDRMVASGAKPWHEARPVEFVADHAETVSSMRARLAATHPERLHEAADAYDAIQSLDDDLETVVSELRPVLPAVEAERLDEIARALDARMDTYAQALDRLVAAWDPLDPPRSPERWQGLLDEVSEHWEAPDRLPILRAAFASLDDASVPPESGDPWAARRAFLAWAVRAPDERAWTADEDEAWTGACADVWRELLTGAMDAGQESRVRDLLEAPALEGVRDRPESVETLREAREWALDRYLFGVATRVRERLPTSEDVPEWRVRLQEAGAFLVHHSAVWTALIVGAIFMEDFGTAWQAMAEQGDIQGIAITFVLAVAGAFGYVLLDLHRKTTRAPGAGRWSGIRSRLTRASAFVALCWAFTLVVTAFLWWLLSGTDQVVHGPRAVLHVVVWSSFALLTGIFLGLVAKAT